MLNVSPEELIAAKEDAAHVLLDVRTPSEHAHARIPWARSLPLFNDDERARVGTTYKEAGRDEAILLGLDIIGPRMRTLVEQAHEIVGGQRDASIVVHCWRGGMRSQSVAWLLDLAGFDVRTLEGGYKSFRRWVLARLEHIPQLMVLGGRTGSGKTRVLHELADAGEPVVDLEGLANHRGSAFGALQLPAQPSQEQFEAYVALELDRTAKLGEPVWVEDESRMIGIRQVPDTLMQAMRESPVIALDVPTDERVAHLVDIYGDAAIDELAASFARIRKRLGGERTDNALAALHDGDLETASRIALAYYDKAYDYGLSLREEDRVWWVEANSATATARVLAMMQERRG